MEVSKIITTDTGFHSKELFYLCAVPIRLFVTLWTIAHQVPLSTEFSKQEYQSKLSFPTPGYLLEPEMETASFVLPALAGEFFTTVTPGKTFYARDCLMMSWKHLVIEHKSLVRTYF